jgi:dihydrofolate reductase
VSRVSWLETSGEVYEKGVSEWSAEEVIRAIVCYVLGSRTYEHALQLGWPYGDTPTVVVTNKEQTSIKKSVEFYSGDFKTLVHEILAPRFGNIWLAGGTMLCQSFLKLGLVDEIRLAVMPVLLGDGLRLFGNSSAETRWRLKAVDLEA